MVLYVVVVHFHELQAISVREHFFTERLAIPFCFARGKFVGQVLVRALED
jgi:hypothetical protein